MTMWWCTAAIVSGARGKRCERRRVGSTRPDSFRSTGLSSLGLGAVRELQSWFHGDYIVILHSGAKLRLSRSFRDAVASRLGRAL